MTLVNNLTPAVTWVGLSYPQFMLSVIQKGRFSEYLQVFSDSSQKMECQRRFQGFFSAPGFILVRCYAHLQ